MIPRKGFVDLQVNGYLGIDFSSLELTEEDFARATRALVEAGTAAFCPTIITSAPEVYERNIPLMARAMEREDLKPHLLGIHLEGPYLSPVEGARGAHDARKMRLPDAQEFERWQDLARGRISIFTLAPELDGALDFISAVRRRHKTRIALGHHMATRDAVRRAVDAGAELCTHLGNGCPNQLPRHDNVIVHQLAEDRLTAGLITDGAHLPDDFIRVAFRCKGIERLFVVSDSAPIAGLEAGVYDTLGHRVRLTASGRIENLHGNHLVGAGCCMAQCMRHLGSLGFLSTEELWTVGLLNPLRVLDATLDAKALAALPDVPL